MEIAPSQTLYINNLNEKVKKNVLKKLLYMVFSQYGRVTQIVACKGIKLRGQAWVVFQETSAAINALRGKQGFMFYDKPLKLAFAKSKSDIVAKSEGIAAAAVKSSKRQREADQATEGSNKEQRIITGSSVPNKIILAQNLPPNFDGQMLGALFQQCPGLTDIRVPPGDRGLAFIEFEDEIQAGGALRQMNGLPVSATATLQLAYSN